MAGREVHEWEARHLHNGPVTTAIPIHMQESVRVNTVSYSRPEDRH